MVAKKFATIFLLSTVNRQLSTVNLTEASILVFLVILVILVTLATLVWNLNNKKTSATVFDGTRCVSEFYTLRICSKPTPVRERWGGTG